MIFRHWYPSRLLWLLVQVLQVLAAEPQRDMKSITLSTHTLQAPFLHSEMRNRWFDFGGDTLVRADQYIRLTSDRPSQRGWIWSRVPLTATNWEIEVEFRIHGKGNLHGDGMAMWLTKDRMQQGPVFGSIDKFEGLGIFFDTYKNNRPGFVFPLVMAMMGDGQTAYDNDNDGKANQLASCSARGIRGTENPAKARLSYIQDDTLRLELQYKSPDEWTECFSVKAPTMPQIAYLGFTAHTGELSDNHDIIKVNTYNMYNRNPVGSNKGESGDGSGVGSSRESSRASRGERKSGGWGWFFIKMVLFFVVCAGGYVGFTIWRTQQRRSSRF